MKVNFKFSNGDSVTEKITGFTGVITGAVCYMTGCNQYLITARSPSPNQEAKTMWYDEGRIMLSQTDGPPIEAEDVMAEANGCDIEAPTK